MNAALSSATPGMDRRERSYAEQRAHTAACLRLLLDKRAQDWSAVRIADIGCGKGDWLRTFLDWGVPPEHLTGIDTDAARLQLAAVRAPGTQLFRADCRMLPLAGGSFDMVTQFTLFTSLLDPDVRKQAAQEMTRIVKPGGVIVWYDFFAPNPLNPNTRPVGLGELADLFPGCSIDAERITFAAPIARMIARVSKRAASAANRSDLLSTHYLALIAPIRGGASHE
ncbi:MAG: class I SAM-dependent methyltransferase [Bryobacteraceae bacterium]